MNVIKAYIQSTTQAFEKMNGGAPIVYSILAEHGQTFTPGVALPAYMTPKQCYANCADKVVGDARYMYAEGLGVCGRLSVQIPLSHAWCVDANNNAHDPTWGDAKGNIYVGVKFSTEFLLDFSERTRMSSIFESLYALRMSPAKAREYVVSGIVK